MKRHSVLVVDDEPTMRSLFEEALAESGHSVAVAQDGADALDQLRDGSLPCVVLTDVRMPRMDGFELSRAVAEDPQLASIPIVVLTGHHNFMEMARQAGCDSFLTKPCPAPKLLAEIRTILERSGRRRSPGLPRVKAN